MHTFNLPIFQWNQTVLKSNWQVRSALFYENEQDTSLVPLLHFSTVSFSQVHLLSAAQGNYQLPSVKMFITGTVLGCSRVHISGVSFIVINFLLSSFCWMFRNWNYATTLDQRWKWHTRSISKWISVFAMFWQESGKFLENPTNNNGIWPPGISSCKDHGSKKWWK